MQESGRVKDFDGVRGNVETGDGRRFRFHSVDYCADPEIGEAVSSRLPRIGRRGRDSSRPSRCDTRRQLTAVFFQTIRSIALSGQSRREFPFASAHLILMGLYGFQQYVVS